MRADDNEVDGFVVGNGVVDETVEFPHEHRLAATLDVAGQLGAVATLGVDGVHEALESVVDGKGGDEVLVGVNEVGEPGLNLGAVGTVEHVGKLVGCEDDLVVWPHDDVGSVFGLEGVSSVVQDAMWVSALEDAPVFDPSVTWQCCGKADVAGVRTGAVESVVGKCLFGDVDRLLVGSISDDERVADVVDVVAVVRPLDMVAVDHDAEWVVHGGSFLSGIKKKAATAPMDTGGRP